MSNKVAQRHRDAAANGILRRLKFAHGGYQQWMDEAVSTMREGLQDDHDEVQQFAAFEASLARPQGGGELRDAAEKARAQFDFYAREHWSAKKFAKAETNQQFADMLAEALRTPPADEECRVCVGMGTVESMTLGPPDFGFKDCPACKPADERGEALREACEHGVRHPHPCDECLDRDIPPGKSLFDHPCYGLSTLDPTEFSHRNSWPLPRSEHPYCSRCGTEIEGENNRQKDGAPLLWSPRPAALHTPPADERGEALRDDGRLLTFLEILAAMGGQSDASEYAGNWINAFCEEYEGRSPDTFNLAIELGLTQSSHNSDFDTATVWITNAGRAALATREAE